MPTPELIADLETDPSPARKIVDVAVMALCGAGFAAMLLGFCMLLLTNNHPGGRDFVSYWTAGHQLLHHHNPYDSAAILESERSVGFPANGQALIMRNAPWALALVAPLGFLSLNAGAFCWSLLLAACLVLAVRITWQLLGRPTDKLHLLGFMFGPALLCVLCGQTAVIALVGLALFLRLHTSRPFSAGAALWLCALKPHLFLPFGIALLLWIVVTRGYRVLAGFAVTMLATSAFATWLDPGVWSQYTQMMRTAGIEREFIPCLSVALRFALRPQAMGLEYIPAAVACAWAATYYWQRRTRWSWLEHGATLMLVSIALAPYAWIMDQALLIPAVMFAVYKSKSRGQLEIFALGTAVMEFAMSASVGAHSAFYLWTAIFWLAWFVYVTRSEATAKSTIALELAVHPS